MGTAGYKNLILWQKADILAKSVYIETRSFPKSEIFGLTSQLRRAALSVPTNIVEGYARIGSKEFKHFLSIALGSLAETEYLIEFSYDLNYLTFDQFKKLQSIRQETGNIL